MPTVGLLEAGLDGCCSTPHNGFAHSYLHSVQSPTPARSHTWLTHFLLIGAAGGYGNLEVRVLKDQQPLHMKHAGGRKGESTKDWVRMRACVRAQWTPGGMESEPESGKVLCVHAFIYVWSYWSPLWLCLCPRSARASGRARVGL